MPSLWHFTLPSPTFRSAFNTIIPSKLITKISDLGINTSLCNWILDFLTNRPQSVRLAHHTSSTLILKTGAPPPLYDLHIEGLSSHIVIHREILKIVLFKYLPQFPCWHKSFKGMLIRRLINWYLDDVFLSLGISVIFYPIQVLHLTKNENKC